MGKVKRLELWWQLYRTSFPVWDWENFRLMDFCWHECTRNISHSKMNWADITINIHRSTYKVPVIIVKFYWNLNILYSFSKKYSSNKFHENSSSERRVVPRGRTGGQTDRHVEANSRFSQFANAPTIWLSVSRCVVCWRHFAVVLTSKDGTVSVYVMNNIGLCQRHISLQVLANSKVNISWNFQFSKYSLTI